MTPPADPAQPPASTISPDRQHPNIPAKGEPYRALIASFVDREYKGDVLVWSQWVADPGEEAQLWVAYDPEIITRDTVDYFINRQYGTPSAVMEVQL